MNDGRKEQLAQTLNISQKKERIDEINRLMQSGDFWADHVKAAEITQELNQLQQVVASFDNAATEADYEKLEKLTLLSGEYDEITTLNLRF